MNEIKELREKSKQLRNSRKELRSAIIQISDLFGNKKKCARCDDIELSNMHCKFNFYDDWNRKEVYTNDESEVKGKTLSLNGAICLAGGDYRICEDIHRFIAKIEIKEVSTYEQINQSERLEFDDSHLFVSELSYGTYNEVHLTKVDNNTLKTIIEDDLITKVITNLSKKLNGQLKDYNRVKEIAQTLANVINPKIDEVIAK